MKSNFWKLGLGVACICATGLAARAAALQRTDVMANPAWLLHLDCDALRPTTIGQYVLTEMDKPEAKAKLAAFQSIFSFDLRTQLHGVTLYGGTPAPADSVLMIYADFDADRLVILAKAAKDSQSSQHNQHVIYNWIDENKHGKHGANQRVYAAIQGNRVIFGQREDRVAAALDVLDGTAPNLASGTGFPDLGASGNTHFVEAAARKMDLPNGDPNAAILKLSQSVELAMGEQQQQFHGALRLVADSDEAAGHILSIAQGLVALMKLQTGKPEAVTLANALVFTQNGSAVLGTIALPASDAVEIMKADAARKAAAHKAKESKE
ncbi:MAG TPA: hypothetical protein VFC07_05230 [Verrucomicrobiae bacterium]|nr:hypothetical protein [Verrucomicrobiae bacterium]